VTRRETRRVLRAYAGFDRPAAPAGRSGRTEQQAWRQVRDHLDGLVACRRTWAQWLLALLTHPVLGRMRRGEVGQESLDTLRRLADRGPLVLLPAHRSYADSLVLAAVLRDAGIPRPWRLAGANLAFWPLGPLARRSGTIFIRRDFGSDRSYHLAVRCYLADLLARAQNLEWYPEAGRSRTGRVRAIRNGMLRLLVAAYVDSGIDDVHVVPVSIVYDVSPDMEAVVDEDAGALKRPEGLRALMHYLRAGRTLGPRCALPAFGEPISLRELSLAATNEWDTARTLAQRVAIGLREATQVPTESLLALVLAADEAEPRDTRPPRSAAALAEQAQALLEHAAARRIPVCRPLRIESALDGMVRTRALIRGPAGFAVRDGRHRFLAYHRNVVEHWFLPRAAAELVATGDATVDRVGELLAPLHAPWASPSDTFERRVEAELAALGDGWEQQPFLLAPRLLGPVFRAYHEAAVHPGGEPGPRSAELRDAAIAVLTAGGLLGARADETARAGFADELSALLTRLRAMAALDAGRPAGIADVRH
jgi:glycerol-3-phosphate O-acyltransferase